MKSNALAGRRISPSDVASGFRRGKLFVEKNGQDPKPTISLPPAFEKALGESRGRYMKGMLNWPEQPHPGGDRGTRVLLGAQAPCQTTMRPARLCDHNRF